MGKSKKLSGRAAWRADIDPKGEENPQSKWKRGLTGNQRKPPVAGARNSAKKDW